MGATDPPAVQPPRAYFDALTVYRKGDVGPIVDVFTNATLAALANADQLAAELAVLQRR